MGADPGLDIRGIPSVPDRAPELGVGGLGVSNDGVAPGGCGDRTQFEPLFSLP